MHENEIQRECAQAMVEGTAEFLGKNDHAPEEEHQLVTEVVGEAICHGANIPDAIKAYMREASKSLVTETLRRTQHMLDNHVHYPERGSETEINRGLYVLAATAMFGPVLEEDEAYTNISDAVDSLADLDLNQ